MNAVSVEFLSGFLVVDVNDYGDKEEHYYSAEYHENILHYENIIHGLGSFAGSAATSFMRERKLPDASSSVAFVYLNSLSS